jgi:hypothetical protein
MPAIKTSVAFFQKVRLLLTVGLSNRAMPSPGAEVAASRDGSSAGSTLIDRSQLAGRPTTRTS